ncbi:MAG: hypothetical protein OHK0046_38710 [Anaerolineae bacterium]
MRWFMFLPLLVLFGCTDFTALFENSEDVPDDSVSSCEVELVLNQHGSHSTMLVYASPFDELVTDTIGGLFGSCRRSDCQWSLPVTGRLQGSDIWYQVIFEDQFAWVDIRDDGRLVGNCDVISSVILLEPD